MENSIVCVICHASGYTACAHRPYYDAAKASGQPDTRRAENAAVAQEIGVSRTDQPVDCISLYKEWRVNHNRPGNMSLTEAAFRAGWEARTKCKI